MSIKMDDGEVLSTKIKFGKLKFPVNFRRVGDKLWLSYNYNKGMTEEFKTTFTGMKWHGFDKPTPIKQWSIDYSEHNMFQIAFLSGSNPYERYDSNLPDYQPTRPCKPHQLEMVSHGFHRRWSILAAEMGLGKSLTAIEIFEYAKSFFPDLEVFWISKSSALHSARLEYRKWNATVPVKFMTYEGLKKFISEIKPGTLPPRFVIFDEAQALKNLQSQRSQAANHLTKNMREFYGDNCFILAMSGSPAPKSPVDWYSICHIVCPGFLKENNIHSFKGRLGIVVNKENSITGGSYPELVAWRDNDQRCNICGQDENHNNHIPGLMADSHDFERGKNEVAFLYERMKGLVLVKRKKDCLDLPDKIYRKITCKPSQATLRAMKLVAATAGSAIKILTRCRELSDGFQYVEGEGEAVQCSICHGGGLIESPIYRGPEKTPEFLKSIGITVPDGVDCEDVIVDIINHPQFFVTESIQCPRCEGAGEVATKTREVKNVSTSKDAALVDLLDEHEDVGRLVVYAGFTASIDRVVDICLKQKWQVIRVDGRGWHSLIPGKPTDLLTIFQEDLIKYEKVVFVGHPGSAGTGVTLTASPSITYYSNDFSGEARTQSEDRIHRIGMDTNRGATIIDLIHLPTDEYVLENLQKKRKLESLSLGEIVTAMDSKIDRIDYDYE